MRAIAPAIVILFVVAAGCQTAPKTEAERQVLIEDSKEVVERVRNLDPGMARFFESSRAYAVFPTVGKGGLGVGGAYGKGVVWQDGDVVGYCDLSQGSIGLQIGGQAYSELIFFQTERALVRFKAGTFELAAQASGVAVRAGGAANADYEDGVAIFTVPKGGLMGEASIGGQNFTYRPRENGGG
jgi:lipid-binding SYLF domain-containing protein